MIGSFHGRAVVFFLLFAFLSALPAHAANAPVLFFEDLQSGPNSGGESINGFSGSYVTLYGNFFGSTQGNSTATLNGANCLRVVFWGTTYMWYQKIVVQLGSTCTSGNFVVTVGGQTSNALSFAVRGGNIYCVTTSGNDASTGKFPSSCWNTITHARGAVAAGDIVYVRNGITQNSDDGFGSPLNISGINGTAANPYALVVYPGETATIGGNANSRGIIQYPNTSQYWVLAGFIIQNTGVASGSSGEGLHLYQGSSNWRIAANSFTCPQGDGFTGCVTTDGAANIAFLGNRIHDTGATGADKTYHAFYFGDHTTSLNQNIEVGWNTVNNIHGCRGIMFHSIDSTPGAEGFNLTVHDNLIHDTQCDGIAFANVNPDKGPVVAYNNVLYNTGTGPDPQGQGANYSCIYVGDTNGSPTTPAQIYNNTCYNGGSRGASQGDAGAFTAYIPARYTNNIVYELPGEAYFTNSTLSQCGSCISGSNNIWFGAGSAPSQTTGNITVDPLFMNRTAFDFHLQTGSPAISAGVGMNIARDVDGVARPQIGIGIGAYESAAGTVVQRPNPPTNLLVTVQ